MSCAISNYHELTCIITCILWLTKEQITLHIFFLNLTKHCKFSLKKKPDVFLGILLIFFTLTRNLKAYKYKM